MVFHLQDLFVLISGIAFTVALGALLFTDAAGLVIAATVFGALSSGTATTLMGINLMQSWDAAPDGFTRVMHSLQLIIFNEIIFRANKFDDVVVKLRLLPLSVAIEGSRPAL